MKKQYVLEKIFLASKFSTSHTSRRGGEVVIAIAIIAICSCMERYFRVSAIFLTRPYEQLEKVFVAGNKGVG